MLYFRSSTKANKGSNLSYLFGCGLVGTDSGAAAAGKGGGGGGTDGGREVGREKTHS